MIPKLQEIMKKGGVDFIVTLGTDEPYMVNKRSTTSFFVMTGRVELIS